MTVEAFDLEVGESHHRRDPRHGISEIWPGPCNPEPRYGPYIQGIRGECLWLPRERAFGVRSSEQP